MIFFADAPRVDLTLGKSISPGSIYEGGDVYFDCLVIASPKPYKILWFQDVSIFMLKNLPFFSSIFCHSSDISSRLFINYFG